VLARVFHCALEIASGSDYIAKQLFVPLLPQLLRMISSITEEGKKQEAVSRCWDLLQNAMLESSSQKRGLAA